MPRRNARPDGLATLFARIDPAVYASFGQAAKMAGLSGAVFTEAVCCIALGLDHPHADKARHGLLTWRRDNA